MAKTPAEGDRLFLDGFVYKLINRVSRDSVPLWEFRRPMTGDWAKHKANFSYKKGGLLREDDLVWCSDASSLREEATIQMVADSKANLPAAWLYANLQGVQQVIDETVNDGIWFLRQRVLLKTPIVKVKDGDMVVERESIPTTPEDAKRVVGAILSHEFVYDLTGG